MIYFEFIKPKYFNYIFKENNTFNMPVNIMYKGYFDDVTIDSDIIYIYSLELKYRINSKEIELFKFIPN
jgi:hypothetical protein